jgi:hypothetical protein
MKNVDNVDKSKNKHRFCASCIVDHNRECYGNERNIRNVNFL